jgi:hypothetical protein
MNKQMKPLPHYASCRQPAWFDRVRAFTLTELMITMAIFTLVVIAMVSLQIFGFKINSLTSNKLRSTASTLKVLDQMRNLVLGATNAVSVGNIDTSNNKFIAIAINSTAIGNALQISNNSTSYTTFYLNTNHILYELGSATNSTPVPLASAVYNPNPFQIENYLGSNILVGSSGHYTVKITLQYSNWLYAIPSQVYDAYRLESRATPRAQFDRN